MKNNSPLTASELMNMIATNLREMNGMKISDKQMPNVIKRATATAAGAQAALKLALFSAKNNKKILLGDKSTS